MPCRSSRAPLTELVRLATAACFVGLAIQLAPPMVEAQFMRGPSELSDSVTIDEPDSSVRAHLERVKAYLADRQWDEAVETLRRVMAGQGSKMIALSRSRYVNLTDYCQVQIAAFPLDALALYREQVDGQAQRIYDEALVKHSSARFSEIVDTMLCSSWGDDALWALGELELEQAHYGAARRCWERLIEVPPARVSTAQFEQALAAGDLSPRERELLDAWYVEEPAVTAKFRELRGDRELTDEMSAQLVALWKRQGLPPSRLAYPGTTIPLADIRARLILVSIMEGSLARAGDELRAFERLHPKAEGRMAARKVIYFDALSALLSAAEKWPDVKSADDWTTFAGSTSRTKTVSRKLDLGQRAWEPIALGEPLAADGANSRAYSLRRIGEDSQRLLSYHPLVDGGLVLFNNQNQVFAFNLRTGKPAWPREDPKRPPGEIFEDSGQGTFGRLGHGLGVARFTMTARGGKLYSRLGSQVTSRPLEGGERGTGSLVCLDLAAEGKVVWNISPNDKKGLDDERWAFEGAPVVEGADVYIALRKSDVRPQAHVACFDAATGMRRWSTFICGAETPGGGQTEEITHNLLTFDQGTLYFNTNLGAIACLSARDGRLQWVSRYRRAEKARPDGLDRRAAHFYRDLNPCIYHQGTLLAAPSDSESIIALDASTGELCWESQLPEDVVHLLGVGHGNLIASGDRLWWIDVQRGKVVHRWPDTSPLGYGRGILMGDEVVWPTAEALYVLPQDVSRQPLALRDPIPLVELREAGGGNLVAADGVLLIATSNKLFAFEQQGAATEALKAVGRSGELQTNTAKGTESERPAAQGSDRAGKIDRVGAKVERTVP